MTYQNVPPLTKLYPFYGPGQWGVQWADRALGERLDTRSNVFYVDSGHALTDDNNDGTDPNAPLQTVTRALSARVAANNNDFIIVRQMNNALETWPLNMNVSRVHLLSVYYDIGLGPAITPVGDNAGILIAADNLEIAGFQIQGGATAGCIDTSAAAQRWGAHIHHNCFGWQGGGQDGIRMGGAVDKPHWMVHDNWFNTPLTRDGIRIDQNSTRSEFWGNHFRLTGAANTGINLVTLCTDIYAIHDNVFAVADAAVGEAIDCNINSANCMFWGNIAGEGMAAMGNVPYQDLSAGANDWLLNYAGIVAVLPV